MKNYKQLGQFKSKGRLVKESYSKYRSPFQRDRDRIIHSAAFRRLKHKTQVFVNTEGDHYRTRITHSLEVAQISRSITSYMYLNDDLAETLSLAHDLGHTPFGHAGEDSLNECMINHGGFDQRIRGQSCHRHRQRPQYWPRDGGGVGARRRINNHQRCSGQRPVHRGR